MLWKSLARRGCCFAGCCGCCGLGGVGCGRVGGGAGLREPAVERCERALQLGEGVGFPEFEVGATLEEFAHALGFLDAGHFDHDLADLALSLQNLDVGLCHAEAVDAGAHHLVGVFDGCCHFLVEHLLHLGVGGGVGDALFLKLGGEDASKVVVAVLAAVGGGEGFDEVGTFLLGFGAGFGECGHELGVVCAFACEVFHHVGHADLKDYVHAAFEVETQADLQFLALLERFPVHVDLFVAHGVKVSLAVFALCRKFLGLLLVVAGHGGEAEVEEANQSQQYCDYFNKSFVLHCV